MSHKRDAVSTIRGYYYQFDYFILQLLKLEDNEAEVCIEGIEDVDVIARESIEAVQCKYYEETDCQPSRVGAAVRPMLRHFAKNKDGQKYKYKLYAHYHSTQNSLPKSPDVEYAKTKFFTYTEKGKKHVLHDELGLTDLELAVFLKRLELVLDAISFEEQFERIIDLLQEVFRCSEYEARYYYYNNAVGFMRRTAVKKTIKARTVSKGEFINSIENKRELFDKWYIKYIGFEKYYKAARRKYFTKTNISPAHRFFLIECDNSITDERIALLVEEISKKWSKLSKRESSPFCPYIYLHGITPARLRDIKQILFDSGFHIWDGYEFKDSSFSALSLARPVNYHVGIKAKIINRINQVIPVVKECNGQKELYQFFVTKPFCAECGYVHQSFQINKTDDVLKIV